MNTLSIILILICSVIIGVGIGIFGGEIVKRISDNMVKKKYEKEYKPDDDPSRKGGETKGTARADRSGEPDKLPLDTTRESGIERRIPIPSDVVVLPKENNNSTGKTSTGSRGFFGFFNRSKK